MSIAIEPLRTILRLEQSKGYNDVVVMGGLDRFLRRWAAQAEEGLGQPGLLRRFRELGLASPSYSTLSLEERRRWVDRLLEWLGAVEAEANKADMASKAIAVKPRHRPRPDHKTPPVPGAPSLDSSITTLPGISSALAARFGKLGVETIRHLLYFFPRRHLDYGQITPISGLRVGEEQTVVATVWEARPVLLGQRQGTEAIVGDETGNIRAVWFNQPYLAKRFVTNARVVLSGRVSLFKGRRVMESPEWEFLESGELLHTGRLVPVYPLTEGLRHRQVRRLMKTVVDGWAGRLVDFLPTPLRERRQFLELPQAVAQAHYPDSLELKDRARQRLAFDELFLVQLGVLSKKRQWQQGQPGKPFTIDRSLLDRFIAQLPFTLTAAQQRALGEIMGDLERPLPMSRLLQGEVGSGKTVVAAAALLQAVANDYQGALMAPTEILAEQHFGTLCQLFSQGGGRHMAGDNLAMFFSLLPRPVTVALLIGSLSPAQKQDLHWRIASGDIDIVVGTHALIQREVEFAMLGLAVVDEQHRFGVLQRSALRQKGFNPHVLVMTATPIPRTLALTLYGDLDLSVLDELPPGRHRVLTRYIQPEDRGKAYAFLRRQVQKGQQAFIICPLIEESEAIETKAAVAEYERLSRGVFPDLRLGLLHGRLSMAEKEAVMHRFRGGELDILVSTPVVEVGIDVPRATVMLVEGADRFGLSQLHQFRGRVGRGQERSYCLLVAETPSEEARQRLAFMQEIYDGFALAEKDLEMRGPGEFFGTRQSGLPDLRMARLSDVPLLELAREEALRLFEEDPTLELPQHRLLAQELTRLWGEGGEWS
ncbi:MAG TPA: ATP-dependent DNA helicase RecG [Dehalococcoidia bacterium]|nr:ATP-dependent DNA helicase RecG [Dehalococcoidia bacterium]